MIILEKNICDMNLFLEIIKDDDLLNEIINYIFEFEVGNEVGLYASFNQDVSYHILFIWRHTNQGHEFWKRLNTILLDLINDRGALYVRNNICFYFNEEINEYVLEDKLQMTAHTI